MTAKHFPNPILTIFSRTVRPGHEADYAEWTRGINATAARFPGNQGATVVRSGPHERDFHTLLQFDSPAHLDGWLKSHERAEWLAKLEGITIDSEEINSLTGMERWFTLPGQGVAQAPPRWKSALLLLVGLYPTSFLMPWLLTPILGSSPAWLTKLLIMIVTIVLMVWGVMPLLTRLFFGWLYPQRERPTEP